MTAVIVQTDDIVNLLGAGDASIADLETLRSISGTMVAADGGARHALDMGWMPQAVIGDLDSLHPEIRSQLPSDLIHHVAEQDSTDFEKCLRRIAAPLVLGTGFLGSRIDHALACFHALMVHAHRRVILIDDRQLVFLCPADVTIDVPEGALISLFPLVPVQAQSHGLKWPLRGLNLAPGQIIGTSNRAASSQVQLTCDRPGLLVILPRPELPAAQAALLSASPWPVPG